MVFGIGDVEEDIFEGVIGFVGVLVEFFKSFFGGEVVCM